MAREFYREQVDIFKLPDFDGQHQADEGAQITIGDLHGNTMKLIFMLVKHGIAKNLNEEDYETLVKIYRKETNQLTKKDLDRFNQILDKLEFNNEATVRLVGDELADRGNNDYFTLKVLEKLNQNNVPLEIILSNHSVEFIEAYEKQDNFNSPMLGWQHAPSLNKMQNLLERGLISKEEILEITEKAYKPALRAISYTLNEEKDEITLYTHAPSDLKVIKAISKKLEVPYSDKTAVELAQTIDLINEKFQDHVNKNTVNTLYSKDAMYNAYNMRPLDPNEKPFEYVMWNRVYSDLDRKVNHTDGYKINFVHGHDSVGNTKDNIFVLDNSLGKFEYMNQGEYTILYSHEVQLTNKKDRSLEETTGYITDDENKSNKNKPKYRDLDLWDKLAPLKVIVGAGAGIWAGFTWGGVIGGFIGGLVGTFVLPGVGTAGGAAAGAAIGAKIGPFVGVLVGCLVGLGINVVGRGIANLFKGKAASDNHKEDTSEDFKIDGNKNPNYNDLFRDLFNGLYNEGNNPHFENGNIIIDDGTKKIDEDGEINVLSESGDVSSHDESYDGTDEIITGGGDKPSSIQKLVFNQYTLTLT